MFKIILLFCLSLLTSAVHAEYSIRQQVEEFIPAELANFSSNTLRVDLEKKFTSKIIKKKDSDVLYLKYFDNKNDVTLGFNKNHFAYIYIELPLKLSQKKPNFYNEVLDQLSKSQKEKIIKENTADISHESGRYIIMNLPEEKLKLEFFNNEKKELRSIILYSKK